MNGQTARAEAQGYAIINVSNHYVILVRDFELLLVEMGLGPSNRAPSS